MSSYIQNHSPQTRQARGSRGELDIINIFREEGSQDEGSQQQSSHMINENLSASGVHEHLIRMDPCEFIGHEVGHDPHMHEEALA